MGTAQRALVLTISDRSAAGEREDGSGPIAVAGLRERGWAVDARIVPDGEPVVAALREAVAAGFDFILTTGGTGVAARDLTPEMTARVLDRLVPGIPELLRADGANQTPTAILSRGLAGTVGRTLIVNLPGSPGAVRDGMRVLFPAVDHAIRHLQGDTEHPSQASGASGGDHNHHDGGAAGAPVVLRAAVTADAVSLADLESLVASAECGATVSFAGIIRDHDHGQPVTAVEYSAHPSAAEVIARIAGDVAGRVGVGRFAVVHRAGCELAIGDVALAVAVATPHRGEAFAGCRDLVESVKRELPVWKRQMLADGTVEWVNCP